MEGGRCRQMQAEAYRHRRDVSSGVGPHSYGADRYKARRMSPQAGYPRSSWYRRVQKKPLQESSGAPLQGSREQCFFYKSFN